MIEKLRLAEIQVARSITTDVIFTAGNAGLLHCIVSKCPLQHYRVTRKLPRHGQGTGEISL